MRDNLALVAVVDQVSEVATVTVHGGEFGPSASQLITAIAAARHQLPVGCLLEIRSGSMVVRNLLELAGWPAEGKRNRHARA